MPTRLDRFDAPGVSFDERLPTRRRFVSILIPVLLASAIAFLRGGGLAAPTPATVGAPGGQTPTDLKSSAAQAIERAIAPGGTGLAFEVIQRSTINVRPGGQQLEVPNPNNPKKTIRADSMPSGTYLERGIVTPAGFHAEIRKGPDDPLAERGWDRAQMELAALVREGKTYRNDGDGWYETDRPPGIGLDPTSVALLPKMLRDLADARDKASDALAIDSLADAKPARTLDGTADDADLPGIIAVDLADATEIRDKAELAFDDSGRLIDLRILARNTHLDAFDLLVETVITFTYPTTAPELPKLEPAFVQSVPESQS